MVLRRSLTSDACALAGFEHDGHWMNAGHSPSRSQLPRSFFPPDFLPPDSLHN